jgi:hypothetical protein
MLRRIVIVVFVVIVVAGVSSFNERKSPAVPAVAR